MWVKLIAAGIVGAVVGAGVTVAAPEFNTVGNRFHPFTYAELTPEQKAFADKELAAGHDPSNGPFNMQLRTPQMAELEAPAINYLRFKAPMQRKLKEIAVLLTARFWGGQYVWYSHRQQALDAGLAPAFITAMSKGERPTNMSEDEAAVYDFCTELLQKRQVSDATFKAFADRLGERNMIEMISLMGHFHGLSALFAVDKHPLPADAPDPIKAPM
jgi:4-carboxymuconolactone decarboxylase